jgi:hypothetical protein
VDPRLAERGRQRNAFGLYCNLQVSLCAGRCRILPVSGRFAGGRVTA